MPTLDEKILSSEHIKKKKAFIAGDLAETPQDLKNFLWKGNVVKMNMMYIRMVKSSKKQMIF